LLPIAGLVLPFIRHPELSVAAIIHQNPVYLNLSLVAALSAGLKYRRPMQTWLDRRFFREACNQEEILRALIVRVATTHSLAEISRLVGDQVDAALHPRCIHVYYREKASSGLTLGRSSSGTHGLRLPDDPRLLAVLEKTRTAISIHPPLGPGGKLGDARLIVPSPAASPNAGRAAARRKEVGRTLQLADKNLLRALGGQMAMVCETCGCRSAWKRGAHPPRLARFIGASQPNCECPRCGTCCDPRRPAPPKRQHPDTSVERSLKATTSWNRVSGAAALGTVYATTDLRLIASGREDPGRQRQPLRAPAL
jgi:hypothetical protein